MKKVTHAAVLALALIFIFSFSAFPGKRPPDKIIFLYCKMINKKVTLQKMEIVDGTLKSGRKSTTGAISYEITDINNSIIEHGSMPAPDIQFHDQIAPGNQELKGAISQCDTVPFVVRLPFNPNYKRASFYDMTNQNVFLLKGEVNLIGSFEIPVGNEK